MKFDRLLFCFAMFFAALGLSLLVFSGSHSWLVRNGYIHHPVTTNLRTIGGTEANDA